MPFRTTSDHARMASVKPIVRQAKFRRSRCPRRPRRPRRSKSVSCCSRGSPSSTSPGPLQVFSSLPGAKVHLIWKRIEPVTSDSVLMLTPTTTFADCPQLDVICVPGGLGTDDMINDEEMLAFLRNRRAARNTSPRSARDRWCWAQPACSKATARRRTGRRWISFSFRRDPDQDARLRRPQPRHRRRRHRRDRFRADAGVAAARPEDGGGDPAPARI